MSKRFIFMVTIFVLVGAFAGAVYFLFISKGTKTEPSINTLSLKKFEDKGLGVSFEIPTTYQQRGDTPAPIGQKSAKPAKNFEQVSPQGLFTVRTESGLAIAANATRMSLIDYIQNNIQQFFPNKYKQYKSISLNRINVAGYDAIEHEYSFVDQDKHKVIAKLVVIPYGNDSAYYLILQASEANYNLVQKDLDQIKQSFTIISN